MRFGIRFLSHGNVWRDQVRLPRPRLYLANNDLQPTQMGRYQPSAVEAVRQELPSSPEQILSPAWYMNPDFTVLFADEDRSNLESTESRITGLGGDNRRNLPSIQADNDRQH